ncbi:PREDICTED: arf-GAP with coiled-coil, ANK repeat and PH domain-containing protein 1-like [Pseudopodoces humilis]|uniref:arf-GAP with coiled-coil, ANK repeat and PH domain-containing protein 1-like n=1 Tax=Pseudopodoces humilis TaxID=181119 RepID=UPI0006B7C4C0|nr:PREDICTED: arf-GAP with coiled-coil, ANK repeat and PH domain-containing protein 1-like [Pseudopodoces humilis]
MGTGPAWQRRSLRSSVNYGPRVLKLCSAVLEAGRVLEGSSRAFAAGLRELAGTPRGDPLVREALEKFCDSLEQMMDSHEELRSCTQSALRRHLQPLREALRGLRSAGRERARSAELLQGALQHHAEVPRRRPLEAQEAAAALGGARGVARARGLDYVLQLNVVQDRKKTEILQFVLSLLEAQAAFLSRGHQGATATRDYRGQLGAQVGIWGGVLSLLEAQAAFLSRGHQGATATRDYRGQLGAQVERAELEGARRQRDLEQRHRLLMQQDLSQDEVGGAAGEAGPRAPPMEGYLYKRASNAFRTWSRRWFFIQSNQLLYLKRARDPPTVVVEDLRLCTVKPCPDLERRFCFEVVSPSKSCVLQADSGGGQRRWVSAVQSGIACAYGQSAPGQPPERSRGVSGPPPEPPPVLGAVLGLEGNGSCCDCRDPSPQWASVNLGITLCIQCSGIHRLDFVVPGELMCALGNRALNGIYEARVEEMGVKRPPPGCSRAQRESWIRAKYVEKKFLRGFPGHAPRPRPPRQGHAPQPGPAPRGGPTQEPGDPEAAPCLHPGALLFWAARRRRLPTMADALAHGADPGWVNAAEDNRTPLLEAVAVNSLLACEFLLQNGASVNQSDSRGRGPLHHATMLGHTGLACLFLKRGADVNAVDADGRDPLTIAMDLANADIVTLLRLAKMRELEVILGPIPGFWGPNFVAPPPGDDTYLDIFRDISLMASDHPEKLARAPPPKHSTL